MPVSDVLKSFRSSGYDKKKEGMDEAPQESSGVRTIKLTDDEVKELQQTYQPGQEQVCEVTGKLEEDGHFHVMSVHAQGGGMEDMAAKVAGSSSGGAPLMNLQTQPSPS